MMGERHGVCRCGSGSGKFQRRCFFVVVVVFLFDSICSLRSAKEFQIHMIDCIHVVARVGTRFAHQFSISFA